MPLSKGIPAPEIELSDQNKQVRRLSEYRGAPVLLFFYPKDDTPGCTTEVCNFRDDHHKYVDQGAVVLGISVDSVHSHAKFAGMYDLPYPLLADEERKTVKEYDVWHEKQLFGKKYMGIVRTSYLIDANGVIAKTFSPVDPDTHSGEVLGALRALPTKGKS